MDAKELKILIQKALEQYLLNVFAKSEFKWKKNSLRFERKREQLEQSILFFFTPPKYNDDNSIGHLNIMVKFDSNDVNNVASKLKGATNKFENIDTFINVDAGLIVEQKAISWRPTTSEELNQILETKIKPLIVNEIIPFLDQRTTLQNLIKDFERKENFFFWTSNGDVALRAIAMYTIMGDTKKAKETAKEYYLKDESYKIKYNNVLSHFSLS